MKRTGCLHTGPAPKDKRTKNSRGSFGGTKTKIFNIEMTVKQPPGSKQTNADRMLRQGHSSDRWPFAWLGKEQIQKAK